MKKSLIILILLPLTSFFSCKPIQNEKEKILLGIWSQEMRSNNKKQWEFTEQNIANLYTNNNLISSYHYSVLEKCPEKCNMYRSKWEIDYYLYLVNSKDSSRTKCYEIIFEDNEDVSIRYLPLEKDTYEILKRVKK